MRSESEVLAGQPSDPGPAITLSARTTLDPGLRHRWDELVAAVPGSDVTQLSGWVPIRREAGYDPLHLLAWRGEELLAGALVLLRRIPLLGQIGYVAYGPLVSADAPRAETVAVLSDALDRLARRRLVALFVQPSDGHEDVSRALLARGFRRSTAGVAPAATIRIDLSREETELRAGLTKRVRRWTGKWERSGVKVRHGGAEDLVVLTDLISRSADHQGFTELSPGYVRTLYTRLVEGDHVEIFVGEVHGEPVAAELFTTCGGVLRCRLTGLDRSSAAVGLSVTSAIDWEAMRWAKARGFRQFDMGGVSAAAVDILVTDGFSAERLAGPDRFKVAFGGRLHHYPGAVELISSSVLRLGYDRLGSGRVGRALVDRARTFLRQGRPTRAGH